MTDFRLDPAELAEEYLRAVVDADLPPDGLNQPPVSFSGLGVAAHSLPPPVG
jgi:hypothetical protein